MITKLTPEQEDYLLEEARERNHCIMCGKKLTEYDHENSCKECE
ncbi:MAG: hypothetical protein AABY22_27140 [Nanoarchaeota archaeon]